MRSIFFCTLLVATMQPAWAEQPQAIQAVFAAEAHKADASFSGFSASRGEEFFKSRHGSDWSCSTCHSDNPVSQGKHTVTGKTIQALAPSANPERFTRMEKVEKWFKRNCNDVLNRPCNAQEKGDVMAYLLSLNP